MTRAASRKTKTPVAVATQPPPTPPVDWPMLARCVGLLIALLLLTMMATLLFRTRLTTVGGSEMSWDRAVFFAVNAATLSGFRLPTNPGDLKPFGQLVDYLLIITAAMTYLLIGGWSLKRVCDYRFSDLAIVRHAGVLLILATLVGASLLLGNGIGLFQALFDATGAFGNCGLFLGRLPEITSLKMHGVLLPLAALGGVSVPVIVDAWESLTQRRKMNAHTLSALAAAAVVYLLAITTLMMSESSGSTAAQNVASAGTFALNARTLGLPQPMTALGVATPWLLMLLMAVGASSGGSGGGIKSNTVWLLISDGWRSIRGQAVTRIFSIAMLCVAGYAILVFVALIALALSQPTIAGEQLLFTAFSAVSNCGLSQQPINFSATALYLMSLAMIAGRVWAISILLCCVSLRLRSDIAAG